MLGRRVWLTTTGNRIVEGFITHLHLREYEFAMDSLGECIQAFLLDEVQQLQ